MSREFGKTRAARERPSSADYVANREPGIYVDVVSGEPLFASLDKFDSGTGRPGFTQPIDPDNIVETRDRSHRTDRIEVRSARGDCHLGEVFLDGPGETGLHYCIDSASLRFVHRDDLDAEGYGQYLNMFTKSVWAHHSQR